MRRRRIVILGVTVLIGLTLAIGGCGKKKEVASEGKPIKRRVAKLVKRSREVKLKTRKKQFEIDLGAGFIIIDGEMLEMRSMAPMAFYRAVQNKQVFIGGPRGKQAVTLCTLQVIRKPNLENGLTLDSLEDYKGSGSPFFVFQEVDTGLNYEAFVVGYGGDEETDAHAEDGKEAAAPDGSKKYFVQQFVTIPLEAKPNLHYSIPLPADSNNRPGSITMRYLYDVLGKDRHLNDPEIGHLIRETPETVIWNLGKGFFIYVNVYDSTGTVYALPELKSEIDPKRFDVNNKRLDVRQRDPGFKFPPLEKMMAAYENGDDTISSGYFFVSEMLLQALISKFQNDNPGEELWKYEKLTINNTRVLKVRLCRELPLDDFIKLAGSEDYSELLKTR